MNKVENIIESFSGHSLYANWGWECTHLEIVQSCMYQEGVKVAVFLSVDCGSFLLYSDHNADLPELFLLLEAIKTPW